MAFSIPKLYNKHSDYKLVTAIFIVLAAFAGFFSIIFEVQSHIVFLSYLSVNDLFFIYIIAGLLGALLFFIYSIIIRYLPEKLLVFLTLAITFLSYIVYFYLIEIKRAAWAPYYGLACQFPFVLLLWTGLWRYYRIIFNTKQLGKLNTLFEYSFIAGIVIGGVFFFLGIIIHKGLNESFLWGGISLLLVIILFFVINALHNKNKTLNHQKETYVPARSFFLFFRSKYTTYLYFFGLLSGIIAYIIHYEFLNVAFQTFNNEWALSKFYGLYAAIIAILGILFSRLFLRKVLFSYDSPYTIILIPALIIIGSVLIIFIRTTLGYADVASFSLFFIFICILKFGYEFSKNSVQVPALRTLFETLDIRYRQIIYSRAEGVTAMSGLFTAGVLLWIANNYVPWNTIYSLMVIIVIAIIWGFVTYKLISLFKQELNQTLEKRKVTIKPVGVHSSVEERMSKVLSHNDAVRVINALRLSAQFQPLTYEKNLRRMIPHPNLEVKKYIVDQIALEALLPYFIDLKNVLRNSNKSEKLFIKPVVDEFERKISEVDQIVGLEQKLNSNKIADKVMAIEFIWAIADERYYPTIISLSKEFEPEVRAAAIKTMARIAHPSFSYLLIEYLSSDEFCAYAFEALVNIGNPAIDHLEKLFNTPHITDTVLTRIIRIYGKIGGSKTVELLLNKLDNQSKIVVEQVILALKESKFQASKKNTHRILNVLVRTISSITQNLQVYVSVKNKSHFQVLATAFKSEIDENYRQIFNLLSLAYNYNVIAQIEELIRNGSPASLSFAIELIDNLVDEDIKHVLLPLIEKTGLNERIRKLEFYFPVGKTNLNTILIEVITRDFNQLSIYPRACALMMFSQQKNVKINPELVFCLYHPNQMLQETAAYVIEKIEPGYILAMKNRIEPNIFESIQKSLTTVIKKNQPLLIDKYRIIKNTNIFHGLTENVLVFLAQSTKIFTFKKADVLRLNIRQREINLFFLLKGSMRSDNGTIFKQKSDLSTVYYSKVLISSNIGYFEFMQDSQICAIDQATIEKLLFDNVDLVGSLITCIEDFRF